MIFDLDGTLRHNDPPGIPIFHRIAARLGVETSPEQRREAERWVHAYWASSDELQADASASDGRREELWLRHVRRHLLRLGAAPETVDGLAEKAQQAMLEEYQPVDRVPPDVLPTLASLRRLGLKLGLLSNRDEPLNAVVDSLGMRGAFDATLAAGEAGFWKPDPRVFRLVADLLEVPPQESIYIGDNYYADVIGAHTAGMNAVLLDPAGLFPEAECPVIQSIGELSALMARLQ